MRSVDENHDGLIDFSEFKHALMNPQHDIHNHVEFNRLVAIVARYYLPESQVNFENFAN